MARVWRDGQKKDVKIYRLLSTASIEEKIYQRQISKTNLSFSIMDQKILSHSFSVDELKNLFSFQETKTCNTHELISADEKVGVLFNL
jgi:DNA repair and recombination protein RAD54B